MANINGCLNQISSLESDIRRCEGAIRSNRKQLDILYRRYRELEALLKDTSGVVNNNSGEIMGEFRNIQRQLSDSFQGINVAEGVNTQLQSQKEEDIGSDGNMSSAYAHLRSELQRVADEIRRLEAENTQLQNQINNDRNSINNIANSLKSELRNEESQANARYAEARNRYQADPSDKNKRAMEKADRDRKNAENNYRNIAWRL